jgi:hypothetical protein
MIRTNELALTGVADHIGRGRLAYEDYGFCEIPQQYTNDESITNISLNPPMTSCNTNVVPSEHMRSISLSSMSRTSIDDGRSTIPLITAYLIPLGTTFLLGFFAWETSQARGTRRSPYSIPLPDQTSKFLGWLLGSIS